MDQTCTENKHTDLFYSAAACCITDPDGTLTNTDISLHLWLSSRRFVANAGDTRAVLGVQEEDGSFSAHTLSNDHNAQNEEEVARIRSEHPPSERKTVIRQVGQPLVGSACLFQHLSKAFPLPSPGPPAGPPHAVPRLWGCEVQVEH